ncbi:MAG TPA: SpoIIE family protein phosphatase [Opitutaceae bacterium]|nr:SpoIIE family protein phosphatase [Opitutaceae bacterium]
MSEAPASPTPPTPSESLDSAILRQLMETIPDRLYFKDLQSRFVRVNQAYGTWHGITSPEEVIGKSDSDLFAPVHADVALAEEQEIIRTGKSLIAKVEKITLRDGSVVWGSTTKMAWRDATGRIIGTFGLTRDATAMKHAEEKLRQERNLLQTIIDHLPSRIFVKDTSCNYVLNNRAHLELLGLTKQEEASGRRTIDFFPGERGEQALADDRQILAGGPSLLAQEKSNFGPEGSVLWSLTTKVPLRDLDGRITGIVGISHDITRRKLAEQELQRRTDEMETDVKMARQIQESFLPRKYPVFPRTVSEDASALRFAHCYIPATTLGGDFFSIVQLSDTKCGMLVCDVMGHGVRAGLIAALIRGIVEELGDRAMDPAKVLGEINHTLIPILEKTGQPMFATAFFGVIDIVTQSLLYANAGHPPPFIVRRSERTVSRLTATDPEPAAGLIENFAFTRHRCAFRNGDTLLGFTDGLFEATDASGQIFGEERLQTLVTENLSLWGAPLIAKLVGELQTFIGHRNFDDDLCVVAAESPIGPARPL